ncbi:hypothetical protein HAX54_018511 [Datura stramonium]|uniref:CUE domain-containing protein n=1 Tax=Datura stramonium TaxID=4076 RepID=A0ABS8UMJ9_DATST|nr:hypothetical protein [Datura stramonium]
MRVCLIVYRTISSSLFLLLFFEPLSIAFETLQAILVHGFQLLDVYINDSANDISNSRISKLFDISAAGSFGEWKGILIRNMGFLLDMMTLLMALAHYVHIWWLHGMAFHLVDAVLFLNIRALLSAIVKRVKGFIKLRIALGTLHGALPDATLEELQTYDDEYVRGDELLAREISMGLDQLNLPGHALQNEASRNQMRNPLESSDWRGSGVDSGWLGLDGAGPSTGIRSAGLGRVQTVMRHLAAVGETYAQTALEDAAWNLWSMRASQAGTSNSVIPPAGSVRHVGGAGGLHLRTTSRATNNNIPNIHTMVETVREVLPHIPDEIIFEDLQRTHSVTVTVNNLLHM